MSGALGPTIDPEAAAFVRAREAEGVTLKSAVLEFAAVRRALPVRRWSGSLVTLETPAGTLPFNEMNGPSCSVAGRQFCDQKQLTHACLHQAALAVPANRAFGPRDEAAALAFAHELGPPVVVKPNSASRGRAVTTGIYDVDVFREAWAAAAKVVERRAGGCVVVERHVLGDDYRCFVLDGRLVSATRRVRANVVGNGRDDVATLIAAKNRLRALNPYLHRYPIPADLALLDALQEAGHDLDHVPLAGARVTLRSTSNLATGGDSVDVTDVMHHSFREVAVRALQAIPGMRYGGVDLLAQDITAPAHPDNHVVSEVEYSPGPGPYFPVQGIPRDIAGAVLESYCAVDAPAEPTARDQGVRAVGGLPGE